MRKNDYLNLIKRLFRPLMNNRGEVGTPTPNEFTATLPEDIRSNPELGKYKSAEELARAHVEVITKSGLNGISEDLRKDPTLTGSNFKSLDDLAKSYIETKALVGKKGVIIPGKDAKPEEIASFRQAIGVPEKPEGYKLTPLENLHQEIKITPESQAEFFAFAHKAGIPAGMADELNKWWLTKMDTQLKARDKQQADQAAASEAALRQEYGADYAKNIMMANQLVTMAGGKDAADAFGNLGDNPVVLRTLINIAKNFSEDGGLRLPSGHLGVTKAEAKRKIEELRADKAYADGNDPRHNKVIAELTELYKIAEAENG